MTENTNGSPPDGTEEADRVEIGEAAQPVPGVEATDRDEGRPDLDLRQRRMATIRKPMGPAPQRSDTRDDSAVSASDEGPTDPS